MFIELKLQMTPGFGIKQRMMDLRRTRLILCAAIVLLAGCRAGKSAESASPASPPSSMRTIARIHWLGMRHLAGETNAAQLMAIWKLSESQHLQRQTLDKLSLAPWPLLHRSVDTNAAALMRPLLDDLVADESCLEIRQTSNQPGELVFAIRLNDRRAALWQTNLARVLESLTDIRPVSAPPGHYGWSLKKHHDPNFLELTRVGDWTIFGAAQNHNGLVGDVLTRIRRGQVPLVAGTTNDWFTADLDLARLAAVFSLSARVAGGEGQTPRPWERERVAEGRVRVEGKTLFDAGEVGSKNIFALNHFYLAVTGDGANILEQGRADFPEPLALDLKPWNIPADLIDEHLSSFTLIRGFQPWVASLKAWNNLQIGPPPNQAYFFGVWGIPAQSYFAAPLPGASNEVDRFADWVLQNQHRWFPTNNLAKFERSASSNGLEWKGLPYMSPFLRSIAVSNQNFIYGGGFPNPPIQPLSLNTVQAALNRTNLVYHDWEMTGARTEQWIYMGQFARLVSHKAQLPPQSASLLWLEAIPPKLGASVTDITQTGPNQLSFTRKSTIGLTGIELNLLADWLESPQFPYGLHTFLAPPPPQ